jgi:SAM-dependent methyltransferase
MTPQHEQKRPYPIDTENVAEMARLIKQAKWLTNSLGLVPSALDLRSTRDILDLACGPGEWAIAMAKHLPQAHITGIDLSQIMIDYAQAWAQSEDIRTIRFLVQDALQRLPFPDASFDLIHGRSLQGFLVTSAWPTLLKEAFRLLRPGGMICLFEGEHLGISTSRSLTQFNHIVVEALRQQDHCFTSAGDNFGITAVQERLVQGAGFQVIRRETHGTDASLGTEAHLSSMENYRTLMCLMQPYLTRVLQMREEEVKTLNEGVLREMREASFQMIVYSQTVVGRKAPLPTSG